MYVTVFKFLQGLTADLDVSFEGGFGLGLLSDFGKDLGDSWKKNKLHFAL
jgi:hypothetical protein